MKVARIVVFGPNLAIDRTVAVGDFRAGRVFRTDQTLTVAGGKGANVARAVKALGGEPHLVGLVAGWTGRFIRDDLEREGIPATLVEVDGLSRTCTLVVDPRNGETTIINEEGRLHADARRVQQLAAALERLAGEADVVVCSGSLPLTLRRDFYARVLQAARRAGAWTLLDSSKEPLLLGLRARPHLIKPNRQELFELAAQLGEQGILPAGERPVTQSGERTLDEPQAGDEQRLVRAARTVLGWGPQAAVVSLGSAGALAVDAAGAWRVVAPRVAVVDPVGAGDSMVAALALGLARGMALAELTAFGVAAGTADVTTFGGGLVTAEAVAALQAGVTVTPLPA
ncbi:1-phosphofructokinase family hexose kinase [Carboxydochorda subterranea]|uniref:Tagatose-6-phosphate kinase n=1 Tax=Carboxydichorda subterranea TaxID=3109565 RepID=A0ABZ1BWU5_9FIRM|nr:1-phosphofructokinase family hexose kinase [Limnochorda sp. L945t]WRP17269.1 1-phosphofructokinase family hexose kinase [Limnochorda sp. L945t]